MRAFASYAFLAVSACVFAAAPASDPTEVVRSLYAAQAAGNGPFFQDKDRALVDRWFVPGLADLIWKDANGPEGEVGVIDGDPLYDAQDMEITNQKINDAVLSGELATVKVEFDNFGEHKSIMYILQKGKDGSWKIATIDWGHDQLFEVLDKELGKH